MDVAGLVRVIIGADLKPLDEGLDKARRRVEEFDRKTSGSFKRAATGAKEFGDTAEGAAEKVSRSNDRAERSTKRMGQAFLIANKGAALLGAAVGTGLVAVGAAVKHQIDAADEMAKAARRMGVGIEELSRLKYAADLSGVSFDQLEHTVSRLAQRMNDAANGSKDASRAFEQVGVKVQNADGSLRPISDVLADIADRFAEMPDGTKKTALAMELMGRNGEKMIPLLNDGAEALHKLMQEADSFGAVFTDEMGAQAEAFNDNLTRLTGTFANIAAQLAKELLPYLSQITDWLVENGPMLAENFGGFVGDVVSFLQMVDQWGDTATQAVEDFNSWIVTTRENFLSWLTEWVDKAQEAVGRFRQTIIEGLTAVAERAQFIAQELADAFANLPSRMLEIGQQIISGLWEGIQARWASVKERVLGLASGIADSFRDMLGIHSPSTVMREIGGDIMKGLALGMEDVREDVHRIAESTSRDVIEPFNKVARDIVGGFVHDFVGGLRQGESAWEAFANAATRALDRIIDKLLNQLLDALFQVNSAGGGLFGGGFLGGLFGGGSPANLTMFAGDILSGAVTGLFARGAAFLRGQLIPFANGAVLGDIVTRPTIFPMARGAAGLMGEAGPEAVMPLRRMANGRLGVEAAGGGEALVTVRFVDDHGREVQRARVRQGADMSLDLMLDRLTAQKIGQPGSEISRALEQRFGLKNVLAVR